MPSLIHALEETARVVPNRGISVLDRRGQKAERRTYAQLRDAARDRASRLAGAGILPADRLLICLPTSWDLIELYFGAVYSGAHPVLVAPPGALGGAAAHAHKIAGLIELLSPKKLICDESTRKELAEFGHPQAAASAVTCAELFSAAPGAAPTFSAQDKDLAFLQLTSGSTGRQRAVMISHASVLHNTRAIGVMARTKPFDDGRVVSWLPLNHDMGLVGCLMFAMTHGLEFTLLRPETFLARPTAWLKQFKADGRYMSPAPNFAYQLCVDRVEAAEVAELQLAGWHEALTGAEMVRPETCRDFSEKFSAAGFNSKRLLPCYGMAEATLAVTGDTAHAGVRTRRTDAAGQGEVRDIVCCGKPLIDTTVRISSAATPGSFLSAGEIGEIWVKSPSIFNGYFNDATATAEALTPDGYLRTGDLGYLHDGELYVTGRIKDLLIIHGHNLMPHELEWIAEAASGGGGAERCGAFSVPKGSEGEQAVLVVEIADKNSAELATLSHDIRSQIGRTLGLPLADLVFVKRGHIPKTTSGKVQRRELRRRYMDGQIERIQ